MGQLDASPWYYAMIAVPPLESYLDDSADGPRKKILAVAGFLTAWPVWKDLERRWLNRLGADKLSYFKYAEWRSLRGEFQKFCDLNKYPKPRGRQAADQVKSDLEAVVRSCLPSIVGFSFAVILPDYDEVRNTAPRAKEVLAGDPYVYAFAQLMYQITWIARRKMPGQTINFTIDTTSHAKEAMFALRRMKRENKRVAESIVGLRVSNDKQFPALQSADLLAGLMKDAFVDWFDSGQPKRIKIPPNLGHSIAHVSRLARTELLKKVQMSLRNIEKRKALRL